MLQFESRLPTWWHIWPILLAEKARSSLSVSSSRSSGYPRYDCLRHPHSSRASLFSSCAACSSSAHCKRLQIWLKVIVIVHGLMPINSAGIPLYLSHLTTINSCWYVKHALYIFVARFRFCTVRSASLGWGVRKLRRPQNMKMKPKAFSAFLLQSVYSQSILIKCVLNLFGISCKETKRLFQSW